MPSFLEPRPLDQQRTSRGPLDLYARVRAACRDRPVPFRAGRVDGAEGAAVPHGRLPDGALGAMHLRTVRPPPPPPPPCGRARSAPAPWQIFYRMGFDDEDIVALSGAHTVGRCSVDRSGFDGQWTEDSLKFDNTYFKEMLSKQYVLGQVCASPPPSAPPADLAPAAALGAAADDEPSLSPRCPGVLQAAGNPEKPQYEHKASGTIMLISDLALLEDDAYKTCPRDAAPTPRHQQVSARSAARTLVLLGGAGTSSGTRRTMTRTLRTSPQRGSSCRRTASPSCATRCERTAAGRARKDRSGLLPPDSPSFPALSLRRTLWPLPTHLRPPRPHRRDERNIYFVAGVCKRHRRRVGRASEKRHRRTGRI